MWLLEAVMVIDKEIIEKLLKEDYEPFAVSMDTRGERVWLKKRVEEEDEPGSIVFRADCPMHDNCTIYRLSGETMLRHMSKEKPNEVHHKQSKPKQGASRGATDQPQAEKVS